MVIIRVQGGASLSIGTQKEGCHMSHRVHEEKVKLKMMNSQKILIRTVLSATSDSYITEYKQ